MNITIHLLKDWTDTVREVFRGSGLEIPAAWSDDELGVYYYEQTLSPEEARAQYAATKAELDNMQATLLEHMESIVIPDIRKRTGYEGTNFEFAWVYQQGEHIIERHSKYRIPFR